MSLREELYNHCLKYVQGRISAAEDAIRDAQASANEETKSSSGDKYETGRAMAQLEIEKNIVQLNESKKLMNSLKQIRDNKTVAKIQGGCIVNTNQGNFYLAISAGKFTIQGVEYFAISPASPIGTLLGGRAKGENFQFNGKKYSIEDIN